MKAVYHISINEVIGKYLNTREAVSEISKLIQSDPCQVIELDFTDVEFMSRSFADEFHKERIRLQNEFNLQIEIHNANQEIMVILQAVSKTQNNPDRPLVDILSFRFSKPEMLSNYLLSI